jgi:hypothetical protein
MLIPNATTTRFFSDLLTEGISAASPSHLESDRLIWLVSLIARDRGAERMISKKFLITSAASVLLCGGAVFAQNQVVEYVRQPNVVYVQAPAVNISNRHGNLRSVQQNIVSAYQKIQNAQAANDGQLGGHAQRAKDLLAQADAELRQAANVANAEGR